MVACLPFQTVAITVFCLEMTMLLTGSSSAELSGSEPKESGSNTLGNTCLLLLGL